MTALLSRPTWPLLAFGAFATSVYLASAVWIVPALATVRHPEALAAALVADLVVLVPLAFALAVRARGGRMIATAPVVALSVAAAYALLPEAHRGVLDAALVLVPVIEVVAVGAVVVAFVRLARRRAEGDVYDRLVAAAERTVGKGAAARAIAYELATFRYALGRHVPPPEGAYSFRQSSGYGALLAGVGVAAALELVGGHILVSHLWGAGAALVHLALSGYAIVWLVGDWRALGARVTTLEGDTLRVRCGLRWSVDIPVGAIETVYHVRRALPTDRPTAVAAPGEPRFAIDLSRPVTATGLYGLRREVTRVAIGADDPDRLLADLADAMAGSENP